jgi:hypothetical protein
MFVAMITAIAFLAIGQTSINYGNPPGQGPMLQNPKYPEEAYLGGQLEAVHGLKPHATVVLGQYIQRTAKPITDLSGYLDMNPRDAMAKQPIKVGYTAYKVTNSTYEGKPCILFESDATRSRIREYKNTASFRVVDTTPLQRYRKVWLTPEGVPLRETGGFRNYQGTWELDAKFGKDDIEITTAGPKGKKTMAIVPAGGLELFANEFKPMVDGDKILMPEKKFSRLDPVTGGIISITAKVGVKWEGTLFLKKFAGQRVDYSFGDRFEVAFVTKDMDLLQVNLPNGESLMADIDPTEGKPVTRLKSGGGG